MTINLKLPENLILKPTITVFGVGGAGGNAINNMIRSNLQGATFVAANTDAQALENSLAEHKIQLGLNTTKGLGAGASPEVGMKSAEESEEEIRDLLSGSNMVFITAGMGGGTGTGAAPVVARVAKELGILTVGVVTKPFHFEGHYRMKLAEYGLSEMQKSVDTLIVIPNQNLFLIANEKTTFADAFKMADDVLHAGVRGVTDLMIMPGLINLDFADIRTVMSSMGKAMMGTGESDETENRAIKAAEAAISNPLLDHRSVKGAKGVLINITGGMDMTLYEVDAAANRIREEVGDNDANIIFGSTFNKDLDGLIRVSVVATGIDLGNTNQVKDMAKNIFQKDQANAKAQQIPESFNVHKEIQRNHNISAQFSNNNISEISKKENQALNNQVEKVQENYKSEAQLDFRSYPVNSQKIDNIEQKNNISTNIIENYTNNITSNQSADLNNIHPKQLQIQTEDYKKNENEQKFFKTQYNSDPRIISPIINSNSESQIDAKPKQSLFSRMINSFRTSNNSENKSSDSRHFDKKIDKVTPITDPADIYDVPAFLRRK